MFAFEGADDDAAEGGDDEEAGMAEDVLAILRDPQARHRGRSRSDQCVCPMSITPILATASM